MNEPDEKPPQSELKQALSDLYRSQGTIPDEVHARIRREAEAALLAQEPVPSSERARILPRLAWAGSLAALFLLIVWLRTDSPTPHEDADHASKLSLGSEEAIGDVDGDQQVNMIDAMLLARRVRDDQASDLRWDLNGDGRVDAGDVKRLAARAVRLNPREK